MLLVCVVTLLKFELLPLESTNGSSTPRHPTFLRFISGGLVIPKENLMSYMLVVIIRDNQQNVISHQQADSFRVGVKDRWYICPQDIDCLQPMLPDCISEQKVHWFFYVENWKDETSISFAQRRKMCIGVFLLFWLGCIHSPL